MPMKYLQKMKPSIKGEYASKQNEMPLQMSDFFNRIFAIMNHVCMNEYELIDWLIALNYI